MSTDHVTSADGTPIAFTAAGSGPGLIVVDGAMSCRGPFNPTQDAIAVRLPRPRHESLREDRDGVLVQLANPEIRPSHAGRKDFDRTMQLLLTSRLAAAAGPT